MRKFIVLTALLALGLALSVVLGPGGSQASSHREAPLISQDPAVDTTDVYMFRSPDKPDTVTLISCWYPFEEPMGGPNYYRFADNALYEMNIDNDGDGMPDITYQFQFRTGYQNGNTFLYNTGPMTSINSPNYNLRQTMTVIRVDWQSTTGRRFGTPTILGTDLLLPPYNIGPRSVPNYNADIYANAVYTLSDGSKVFAGPTDDPFWVDLGVFDLLALRNPGVDNLKGFNVHSIALQVPISKVRGTDPVIGTWATASRQPASIFDTGKAADEVKADAASAKPGYLPFPRQARAYAQVSRLGMPLVNEVVIALQDKDRFNASEPVNDGQFLKYVTNPELPKLLTLLYPSLFPTVPATPRNDLVTVFLTGIPGLNQPKNVRPSEMLRLNVETAPAAYANGGWGNPMGVVGGDVAGFPNGRRLSDNVVDIELQVAAGSLLGSVFPGTPVPNATALSQSLPANDVPFMDHFPYLAAPHQGFNHMHDQ
ncbi:MAG: DUF4331 domain-containing protein [Anaerolineae bacterium]